MPVPVHFLARSVSDYGVAVQGRAPRRARVILEFDDGESLNIRLPERLMIVAGGVGTQVADEPTSIDEKILRVIDAMQADALMSGKEIADRAGHTLSGTFQSRLTALAREGRIRVEGKRGYGPIADE